MALVTHDRSMIDFFERRLADADQFSRAFVASSTRKMGSPRRTAGRPLPVPSRCTNLDELRRFGLPLYIALP
jgi:hypothetical protein